MGQPTFFVRFGGCDLRCGWCDSKHTWQRSARCRIERRPGSADFRSVENPLPLESVVEALTELGMRSGSIASLTGGEPLLQPEAVAVLAKALRGRGCRVHLETHGLAVAAISQLAAHVHVVSMDWKLASDVRRASDPSRGAVADFHDLHEAFLKAAIAQAEVVVKVVVTRSTEQAELDEVCRRMAPWGAHVPLILQPVTPVGRAQRTPDAAQLLAWTRRCAERLPDVRLIPQTHTLISVL